ncbi:hypothetical protein PtA15_5A157 [Puccinia triticina]|uniref:Uncharacterized protein n=1 Tax=Puccinia triticina TaxID=208348 RepID=A0ABY7CH90_9BASI|nr:uncharacterized protein PtA15_5A157 [Puccinia triticina]WAQ84586.1 hypothetical protein PtA15_5A157 [Puccinia triticina]
MTTRSTKMIPMGAASNNPTATASPNHPTPTKRKRSQLDLTTTATPAPTSWLGIAFQLPSVIKKEINDFVKANESTRTRRYLKRSSRPTTATNPRHPQRCSPARTRKTPEQEEDRPPRLPSPHFSDFDLPSPNKKLRRAEKLSSMTLNDESGNQARNDQITQLQQQQHAQLMSLGQPIAPQTDEPANINHSPPTQNFAQIFSINFGASIPYSLSCFFPLSAVNFPIHSFLRIRSDPDAAQAFPQGALSLHYPFKPRMPSHPQCRNASGHPPAGLWSVTVARSHVLCSTGQDRLPFLPPIRTIIPVDHMPRNSGAAVSHISQAAAGHIIAPVLPIIDHHGRMLPSRQSSKRLVFSASSLDSNAKQYKVTVDHVTL